MNTVRGRSTPIRPRGPDSAEAGRHAPSLEELATLLASGFLRWAELSRRSAIFLTDRRRYSLEVPAEVSPDDRENGATP